jgi:hypothetical protein
MKCVLLIGNNKSGHTRTACAHERPGDRRDHLLVHLQLRPPLSDAQLLILDDAHAAESAVSGPWWTTIERSDGRTT